MCAPFLASIVLLIRPTGGRQPGCKLHRGSDATMKLQRNLLASLLASTAVYGATGPVNLDACPGYKAAHVVVNGSVLSAELTLAGNACNVYGPDVEKLKLEVTYETSEFRVFFPLHAVLTNMQLRAFTLRSPIPRRIVMKSLLQFFHVPKLIRPRHRMKQKSVSITLPPHFHSPSTALRPLRSYSPPHHTR